MSQSLPTAHPAVIFKSLPEGAVLFSASDEVYFGLNEVGARVWELLPPALSTVDELCAELSRQYPDVDQQTIRADVEELLSALTEYRLVVLREVETADASGNTNGAQEADRASAGRVV